MRTLPKLATLNKKVARQCLSVIFEDKDGRAILDFLSPDLPSIFGISEGDAEFNVLRKSIEEGLSFVSREYRRFVSEKSSKLAFRYALLREYYMNRVGSWDEKT